LAIPKASTEAHVRENAAAGALRLTRDDIAAIDAAFPVAAPRRAAGDLACVVPLAAGIAVGAMRSAMQPAARFLRPVTCEVQQNPSRVHLAGGGADARGVGTPRQKERRPCMRKRRPAVASLDEVEITREGDDAVIEYKDPQIATTYFRVGPSLCGMSDQEILDEFNAVLRADAEAAATYEHVALEIPEGRPQIRHFAPGDQWVPRGGVLRCVIDDSGPGGEAVIYVDDQALSLEAFGRLLCTYAGWGMRIAFVPEEALATEPTIEVREPDEE
jgi:hypothetical protein